jgi:hypothetical protein
LYLTNCHIDKTEQINQYWKPYFCTQFNVSLKLKASVTWIALCVLEDLIFQKGMVMLERSSQYYQKMDVYMLIKYHNFFIDDMTMITEFLPKNCFASIVTFPLKPSYWPIFSMNMLVGLYVQQLPWLSLLISIKLLWIWTLGRKGMQY